MGDFFDSEKYALKSASATEWIAELSLNLFVCEGCMLFTPSIFTILKSNYTSHAIFFAIAPERKEINLCHSCKTIVENHTNARRKTNERKSLGFLENCYSNGERYHESKKGVGCVYVCGVVDKPSLFKIGCTVGNGGVRARVLQQPYLSYELLFLTAELVNPFRLENFLHCEFSSKIARYEKSHEIFELTDNELGFIKNIKTYNGDNVTIKTY